MYIHNYQIHNVLNVYRKQLSQGPGAKADKQAPAPPAADRVQIFGSGQRQSLIDQVSAEIVDRIAKAGPQKRFDRMLGDRMANDPNQGSRANKGETEFAYTAIDESNRKIYNTLRIEKLRPLIDR